VEEEGEGRRKEGECEENIGFRALKERGGRVEMWKRRRKRRRKRTKEEGKERI
jgi:hypothetical protein